MHDVEYRSFEQYLWVMRKESKNNEMTLEVGERTTQRDHRLGGLPGVMTKATPVPVIWYHPL
jgi:hypothetical protein